VTLARACTGTTVGYVEGYRIGRMIRRKKFTFVNVWDKMTSTDQVLRSRSLVKVPKDLSRLRFFRTARNTRTQRHPQASHDLGIQYGITKQQTEGKRGQSDKGSLLTSPHAASDPVHFTLWLVTLVSALLNVPGTLVGTVPAQALTC
jgi:hypothetical protein